MEFSKEEQSKIDKLPIVLRHAVKYLINAIESIINGECDEDSLTDTMATLTNNAHGKYNDNDLLTYDAACKELRISITNRVKLQKLCAINGIKQVIIHNQKVGFRRSEILALKAKLDRQANERRLKIIQQ